MSEVREQSAEQACAVIAELREVVTPEGRVWRFTSSSEGVVDHAWQQRDQLLRLSNGAAALEICWLAPDGQTVRLTHAPLLPAATPG